MPRHPEKKIITDLVLQVFLVLRIECKASHMLGKHFGTELQAQLHSAFFT